MGIFFSKYFLTIMTICVQLIEYVELGMYWHQNILKEPLLHKKKRKKAAYLVSNTFWIIW